MEQNVIKIPKIFHQIWVGPNPFPNEFREYQKIWLEKHPGWKLMFWTENNLPQDMIRTEGYEKLRIPSERSDILRLEVLYLYGGVYIDTDMCCLKNIEPLIDGCDLFLAYKKPGHVNGAFIGSTKGHKTIVKAIKNLRPAQFYSTEKPAIGPLYLNTVVKENLAEFTIFDPGLIYPSNDSQMETAYAKHLEAGSWVTKEHLERKLKKLNRKNDSLQKQLQEYREIVELPLLRSLYKYTKRRIFRSRN